MKKAEKSAASDAMIITFPHPVLQKICGPVNDVASPEIQEVIEEMLKAVKNEKGLGLAAPQIGKSLRLCVVEGEGKTYVLINPVITSHSKKTAIIEEGCLSLPGQFFAIERPIKVTVKAKDRTGGKIKLRAKGFFARALQHEIDHLDGVLIIDRIK